MLEFEDATTLSMLLHLNSEPWLNDEAYRRGAPHPEPPIVTEVIGEAALPPPRNSGLLDLLGRRRSCRAFVPTAVPLVDVSDMLAAGYGMVGAAPDQPSDMPRRSVPSAGGLYPLELLVALRRIDGLDDGLYRYDPRGHALDCLRQGDLFPSVLSTALYAYPFIEHANGLIAIASVFARNQRKYGPRGYRYALLESGHIGQNLCLAATELGLASLCIGGYVDSRLVSELGLDPSTVGVLHAVAFGRPDPTDTTIPDDPFGG